MTHIRSRGRSLDGEASFGPGGTTLSPLGPASAGPGEAQSGGRFDSRGVQSLEARVPRHRTVASPARRAAHDLTEHGIWALEGSSAAGISRAKQRYHLRPHTDSDVQEPCVAADEQVCRFDEARGLAQIEATGPVLHRR